MRETLYMVFTTVPTTYNEEEICKSLVQEGLVACIWVLPPHRSYYSWRKKIETSQEKLIVMKTRKNLLRPLLQRIQSFHPYQVPEIVAVRADQVSDAYHRWVLEVTSPR